MQGIIVGKECTDRCKVRMKVTVVVVSRLVVVRNSDDTNYEYVRLLQGTAPGHGFRALLAIRPGMDASVFLLRRSQLLLASGLSTSAHCDPLGTH